MCNKTSGGFFSPIVSICADHNPYYILMNSKQMEFILPTKTSQKRTKNSESSVAMPHEEHGEFTKNTSRKRSKACTNCRKSKVKCVKLDSDAVCKRCRTHGLRCVYEFKIASYKVVGDGSVQNSSSDLWNTPQQISPPLLKSSFSTESKLPLRSLPLPRASSSLMSTISQSSMNNVNPTRISDLLNSPTRTENMKTSEKSGLTTDWQNSVNGRLEEFDAKLENIMRLLEARKEDVLSSSSRTAPQNKKDEADSEPSHKRPKIGSDIFDDGRSIGSSNSMDTVSTIEADKSLDDILTRDQARDLLNYFNTNISTQLFGFNIKDYTVDSVWNNCPLLIATICCISSIHHHLYTHLFTPLECLVHKLSQNVIFRVPNDEMEAFNTVMALCFCGFWFQDHQMFTGLALQLAKNMRLVSPQNKKSKISRSERVKLWYLLYILDGEQSLAFNRRSMVSKDDDFLKNGKKLLLGLYEGKDHNNEDRKSVDMRDSGRKIPTISTDYSDLRLVSQVEYHQAIDSVFGGNAWGLLKPSAFGLPFQTNLELDRWMVQWTVLLSPMKDCSTWSSKSTLIYYSFAKMHINSTTVRRLQIVDSQLPDLDQCDETEIYDSSDEVSKRSDGNERKAVILNSNGNRVDDIDNDNDDNSLEQVTQRTDSTYNGVICARASPEENKKLSRDLALSAAETVLKFVLGDSSIVSSLKYAPIHIHIMLYYAALLILKPPAYLAPFQDDNFERNLEALRLVKNLRIAVINNSPTDREFASRLVDSLSKILKEKYISVRRHMEQSADRSLKLHRLENVLVDKDDFTIKKRQIKVMAWPGYNSGHPNLEETN